MTAVAATNVLSCGFHLYFHLVHGSFLDVSAGDKGFQGPSLSLYIRIQCYTSFFYHKYFVMTLFRYPPFRVSSVDNLNRCCVCAHSHPLGLLRHDLLGSPALRLRRYSDYTTRPPSWRDKFNDSIGSNFPARKTRLGGQRYETGGERRK